MLKKILATALVATIGFSATQEVNIYSHRHYDTDRQR